MPRLFDEWLTALQRIPPDDFKILVIGLSLLAIFIALVGRHRATLLETAALAALALIVSRYWELASLLLATASVLNGVRGRTRYAQARYLTAMQQEIDAINGKLGAFLEALDRRSREMDARTRDLEDRANLKIIGDPSAFVPGQPNVNGKTSEALEELSTQT